MDVQPQTSTTKRPERRRERRDRVSVGVVISCADANAAKTSFHAQLLDISPHGARFRTTEEVPLHCSVKFDHIGLGIGGHGIVRYCNWSTLGFEVGVEFRHGTGWQAGIPSDQAKTVTS